MAKTLLIYTICIFSLLSYNSNAQVTDDPYGCKNAREVSSFVTPSGFADPVNNSTTEIRYFDRTAFECEGEFMFSKVAGGKNLTYRWETIRIKLNANGSFKNMSAESTDYNNADSAKTGFIPSDLEVNEILYYKCVTYNHCMSSEQGQPNPRYKTYIIGFSNHRMYESFRNARKETPTNINTAKIYPNPATDLINVEFIEENSNKKEITIYDANGNIVKTIYNVVDKLVNIDVSMLIKGNYFLSIDENGEKDVKQIIIR